LEYQLLTKNLKKAFSIKNLKQAWLWTRTNPDAQYKRYFRHIYKAYSLAVDDKIKDLHRRLKDKVYKSVHATKIYLPKKSGILRPYTLLSIEDQIVYQALVNIIAEKLYPKVRRNYYVNVFGHIYADKKSFLFYRKWQVGYKKYFDALEDAYNAGYRYGASFDLTACYDSIDHRVLSYFLTTDIGLEKEFVEYFCDKLSYWSASSDEEPIYQGHGIPQGPQPSGIVSECVLKYFDQHMKNKKETKYFRYVDDIRLMAKSENDLRLLLIDLDMLSKKIGLFPQASKIDIHKIKNIQDEIKNISHPPEIVVRQEEPDQKKVFKRIGELSKRYKVENDTRFKYVLGGAKPSAKLHLRLNEILKRQPHLYPTIFHNLSKADKLTQKVSHEYIKILTEYVLYEAFTAELIKTLHGRIHDAYKEDLIKFCRKSYKTEKPQLKVAVAKVLIDTKNLTYKQTQTLIDFDNWWARSNLVVCLREDVIDRFLYKTLINKLLRDKIVDVGVVASDICIENSLKLDKPSRDINRVAQISLKKAGLIGKIATGDCFIRDAIANIVGPKTGSIDWRKILGRRYSEVLPKIVRWVGYSQTDPTAWVNITDTINDTLLDILFQHDREIGSYQHGNIGGVLSSKNKFSKKYPDLFNACKSVHDKRLESDLSHPRVKITGKPTKYITYKDMKLLIGKLCAGYIELWGKWDDDESR